MYIQYVHLVLPILVGGPQKKLGNQVPFISVSMQFLLQNLKSNIFVSTINHICTKTNRSFPTCRQQCTQTRPLNLPKITAAVFGHLQHVFVLFRQVETDHSYTSKSVLNSIVLNAMLLANIDC